jgi:hypothetical protein
MFILRSSNGDKICYVDFYNTMYIHSLLQAKDNILCQFEVLRRV